MPQQKITVLEAMKILSSSWGELSAQTINFLKKRLELVTLVNLWYNEKLMML